MAKLMKTVLRRPCIRFVFILQLILSSSLGALENTPFHTYLPHYRVQKIFPRDLQDSTSWFRMAPFSRINDWRSRGKLPHSYDFSSGERLMSRFDEILYFSLIPLDLEDPEKITYMEEQLEYLKRIPDADLSLSLSGSSADFMPLMRDDSSLQAFLDILTDLQSRYALKGLDLDWEFPKTDTETEAYLELLKILRRFCDGHAMELTIAVSRFRALPDECYTIPDRIHLMSYDFYGRHSTVESTREAMEYMAARYDIEAERLIMGIPYYGRVFDGNSPDYWKKAQSYREIINDYNPLPHENEAGGYFFNGSEMVQEKASMALELGSGCFIWEIGQDSLGRDSLTAVLFRSLNK